MASLFSVMTAERYHLGGLARASAITVSNPAAITVTRSPSVDLGFQTPHHGRRTACAERFATPVVVAFLSADLRW